MVPPLETELSLNELLETKLTLWVSEMFPPKSVAYALTVLVPLTNAKVTDQLVQPLVVVARLQALVFN